MFGSGVSLASLSTTKESVVSGDADETSVIKRQMLVDDDSEVRQYYFFAVLHHHQDMLVVVMTSLSIQDPYLERKLL